MHLKRLKRHLQSTIMPTRYNSWHPYLLRSPALAFAALSVAVMLVTINVDNGDPKILGVSNNLNEADVIEATNRAREKAGQRPLQVDRSLSRAAALKAENMFDRDYWDHYGPDGETPWQFIRGQGYDYSVAGENLARDFQTGEGVVAGWMRSREHRDNLLKSDYKDMGVAAVHGLLKGRPTTVVVALYARPVDAVALTSHPSIGSPGEVLPAHTSYWILKPLNPVATMPLASQIIGLVCLGFGSLYLTQHIVVRNQHLLWDRHIHPHPLLQAALFFGFTVMLIQISLGAVG